MGVVFFPSFPFMGVMLFPSIVLGNASGEGGTLFVSLSLFSPLLSLSLLSSPFPYFSVSLPLFLLFLLPPLLVRTPSSSLHLSLSLFLFLEIFPMLRELLVLSLYIYIF